MHYLLARLHTQLGNIEEAQAHLKEAEHEFFNMCLVKTKEPEYIFGGLEEFRKLRERKRKTKRQLDRYKSKLLDIAEKIGYDAKSIWFAPTSANPKNEELTELILNYI